MGSLKSIQKEHNIQPDPSKAEIDHHLIIIGIYRDSENLWRPYLVGYVLGLAYVVAKHGNNIQKTTGVSYENSLTDAFLGWSCLGELTEEDNKTSYTAKKKRIGSGFHKKNNLRKQNTCL